MLVCGRNKPKICAVTPTSYEYNHENLPPPGLESPGRPRATWSDPRRCRIFPGKFKWPRVVPDNCGLPATWSHSGPLGRVCPIFYGITRGRLEPPEAIWKHAGRRRVPVPPRASRDNPGPGTARDNPGQPGTSLWQQKNREFFGWPLRGRHLAHRQIAVRPYITAHWFENCGRTQLTEPGPFGSSFAILVARRLLFVST